MKLNQLYTLTTGLILLAATLTLHAADPVVSNVRASQRIGGSKLVDILYDVAAAAADPLAISVAVTVNDSPIAASNFSGDIGHNVTRGNNRQIIWDAGADWNGQYSSAVRFTITADAETTVSVSGLYLVVDLSAGPSASSYPVTLLSTIPAGGWTDAYKTTKLVMRKIPAGTFTMGSPSDELERVSNETQHQVTLTQDFYIGVFEVTQRQWERVMGTWPSYFNNTAYRDSRPVEQVSYNDIRGASAGAGWPGNGNVDANSFMGRLRARTGRAFDLPTASQWEYAGRAGTTTALNSGKNLTGGKTCPHMSEVGRYLNNGGSEYSKNGSTAVGTAKVGSYLPNAWGLYDIHGNVWEWCLDWADTYPGTVTDPRGATQGSRRENRSGGLEESPYCCRVAYRNSNPPDETYYGAGFRVVLPPSQQ